MTKTLTSAPFGVTGGGRIQNQNLRYQKQQQHQKQTTTGNRNSQQRTGLSSSSDPSRQRQGNVPEDNSYQNNVRNREETDAKIITTTGTTTLPTTMTTVTTNTNTNSTVENDPTTGNATATVATATNPYSKNSKKNVVTPTSTGTGAGAAAGVDPTLYERIHVRKEIVDELLLVCGVIGTTIEASSSNTNIEKNKSNGSAPTTTIVPVTDCLNWLQDLQRVLRRDDDCTRPISLLLGQWNVVQQKLIPLVLQARYDTAIVLTVCKILVIVTKPLNDTTLRAGQMIIDTKSGKYPDSVIKEQIKLRENALQQVETLLQYKRAFCYHPSHLVSSNNTSNEGGVLSVFVSLLAEPLSRTGSARTDADHLTIELVLHLFRNLLSIEPILHTSSDSRTNAASLHAELISLFERELVFDILLVLGADIELRENAQYNLLLMELLHHLLRNQDPVAVARCGNNTTTNSTAKKSNEMISNSTNVTSNPSDRPNDGLASSSGGTKGKPASSTRTKQMMVQQQLLQHQQQRFNRPGVGLLSENLFREKQRQMAVATNRHSHFGGTIRIERPGSAGGGGGGGGSSDDGPATTKRQYVSAALAFGSSTGPTGGVGGGTTAMVTSDRLAISNRRKNKKLEPFIGASTNIVNQWPTNTKKLPPVYYGKVHERAQRAIHNFCIRFITDCYGPVMKSLKNEFRRDSARLEENDTAVLFRIIWFFCQWYRLSDFKKQQQKQQNPTKDTTSGSASSSTSIGKLIFTMDVFTFNLVNTAIETYLVTKKYTRLAQAVALLSEMMHLLYDMFCSRTAESNTEHIMALGLMDRLFYGEEPMDSLPKLLSKWTAGTNTREYLCNVLEVCYMTLKLLDANAKICRKEDDFKDPNNTTAEDKHDTLYKMKKSAADFDVSSYFARKVMGNNFILACTNLLSMYDINAPHVNHRIIAMFLRTCKHVIALPDDSFNNDSVSNPLRNLPVTYEPILYNIQLFTVVSTILNDTKIRKDKDYTLVLNFASTIMYNFATNAMGKSATDITNPLLFVEPLFKHPLPHRYCEHVTNLYVSEELRMLVDLDTLREETIHMMDQPPEDEEEPEDHDPHETNAIDDISNNQDGNMEEDEDNDDEEIEFVDNTNQLVEPTNINQTSNDTTEILNKVTLEDELNTDTEIAPSGRSKFAVADEYARSKLGDNEDEEDTAPKINDIYEGNLAPVPTELPVTTSEKETTDDTKAAPISDAEMKRDEVTSDCTDYDKSPRGTEISNEDDKFDEINAIDVGLYVGEAANHSETIDSMTSNRQQYSELVDSEDMGNETRENGQTRNTTSYNQESQKADSITQPKMTEINSITDTVNESDRTVVMDMDTTTIEESSPNNKAVSKRPNVDHDENSNEYVIETVAKKRVRRIIDDDEDDV